MMVRGYETMNVFTILLLCVSVYGTSTHNECHSGMVTLAPKPDGQSSVTPKIEKHNIGLLIVLGFGGMSVLLAIVHNAVRQYVYKDTHNLDTVFDAGGRVTLSLTAVTVTSQLLWPTDFIQGATTSLKIVYAMFGKSAHLVYCCVGLFVNLMTTTFLILAAKAALPVLVKDISYEFLALILALLFGSYCFIGGLGTTFYISYFNTALTFVTVLVFIVEISYTDKDPDRAYATHEEIYKAMTCAQGPEGNYQNSLLTFRSRTGIILGVIMFLFTTSLSFCDQANWQSRIAAKPSQGVIGFFIAGYLWFAIPTSVSMMSAMTYVSMSYQNHTHLLSATEIDSGNITPFIMETLMGSHGAYLMITMVTMALMSTGSGEVMAVSSIIVYDIYKTYINPFRKHLTSTQCCLCGNDKVETNTQNLNMNKGRILNENDSVLLNNLPSNMDVKPSTLCECPPADRCEACRNDIDMMTSHEVPVWGRVYSCEVHGKYRHYEDHLLRQKTWCIVWVTIAIVPYALVILTTEMDLNWAFFTLQSLLSPFVGPLLLTFVWAKSISAGVISGLIAGLVADVAGTLVVASSVYEGGLSKFMENTVQDFSLLAGTLSGLLVSVATTIIISLKTHNIRSKSDADHEWQKTLSIDNPLHAWRLLYKEELSHIPWSRKITSYDMNKMFRRTRYIALYGGIMNVSVFMVVIPAVVLQFGVLTFSQFNGWIMTCQVTCMIGAVFSIIVPPVQEILQYYRHYQHEQKIKT